MLYKLETFYGYKKHLTKKELFSFFDFYFRIYRKTFFKESIKSHFSGDFNIRAASFTKDFYLYKKHNNHYNFNYCHSEFIYYYHLNFYKLSCLNKTINWTSLNNEYKQSLDDRNLLKKRNNTKNIKNGSKNNKKKIKKRSYYQQKNGLIGEIKSNHRANECKIKVRAKRNNRIKISQYDFWGRYFDEKKHSSWKNKKKKYQWQK